MPALKPFQEVPQLVASLKLRGLLISDANAAATYLRKVGYFRSGGYRYVFRQMLPPEQQSVRMREFRSDMYEPGATLQAVRDLEEFDSKLRHTLLLGLSDFEVRLRAALAHVLARRDVLAHASTANLDPTECSATVVGGGTKFEAWTDTYKSAIHEARDEDFIAHQLIKYNGVVPVWAVVEVLSFGSLPYLFELMTIDDRREVAGLFGVKQENKFAAWVRAMCDLRNYCAHGTRVFNRVMKRAVAVVPSAVTPGYLDDLTQKTFSESTDPHSRIYAVSALLAYMLRMHSAGTNWHNTFKSCLGRLPVIHLGSGSDQLVTLEGNMGFPSNWKTLPLWT